MRRPKPLTECERMILDYLLHRGVTTKREIRCAINAAPIGDELNRLFRLGYIDHDGGIIRLDSEVRLTEAGRVAWTAQRTVWEKAP